MAYRLSKSRFQTGLQCPKALWLQTHEPTLADPVPESRQHVFDTGTRVGELARELFAGGVLVAEDHTQSAEALETTRRLLEDPPQAIFEAALFHENVYVRPDVLVRLDDGLWDLYEVKSSTKVKAENITDVAVQMWVLEGAGLRIRNAHLMHVDNSYVYDGNGYDLGRLFLPVDVTVEARSFLPKVRGYVADMLAMLDDTTPETRIGKHCKHPYDCAFLGHCHGFLPEKPVTALPRISGPVLDSLIASEIYSIPEIPADFPGLTATQREVCRVVRAEEALIVGDVERSLADLKYPVHFLDFETFMSALPLYAATRPYQQVPFQWSDHVLHADGSLEHLEFLHAERSDPRPAFIESLVAALGDTGSVVVYTSFENTQLKALARDYPEWAPQIEAIQARLFDLHGVVRDHVRHHACLGSTSIKSVLPALVEDLSYERLAIAEGNAASLAYLRFQTERTSADEAATLFNDLREYCGTDTLAMAKLLEALRG